MSANDAELDENDLPGLPGALEKKRALHFASKQLWAETLSCLKEYAHETNGPRNLEGLTQKNTDLAKHLNAFTMAEFIADAARTSFGVLTCGRFLPNDLVKVLMKTLRSLAMFRDAHIIGVARGFA